MATNLALDPELLELTLKLSGKKTKKAALTLAMKEFISKRWVEENRDAIEAFNADIKSRGLWSDGMRTW